MADRQTMFDVTVHGSLDIVDHTCQEVFIERSYGAHC